MSLLDVQSTTIRDYANIGNVVFIFSASGVDIYETSYVEWTRLGYASLSNVTSGDVNDDGIWFGTSDSGVWFCPFGQGSLTSQLRQYYATSGTQYGIQSNAIDHVAGSGSSLLVTHDAGAEYFPGPGTPFQYADASGCGACAVNGTYIAYAVASGMHTLLLPTADWDAGDATVLTTASSPALSSNTENHMIYGSGNNLVIAGGAGIDIYDYTDVVSFDSGNIPYVWATAETTQVIGDVAYVDSSADVIIYNIDNSETIETHAGTFDVAWINSSYLGSGSTDLALYDDELERHAFINYLSPADGGRDVTRSWTIYFEIGDTIHSMGSLVLKVNGATVTPTIESLGSGFDSGFSSGFGGEGFKVTYTPPSASGYRKTVTVEIIGTDGEGSTFTENTSFITETVANTASAATKPPNVVLYKDLSLTEFEDTYNGDGVNWLTEKVTALYVSESQAKASATVAVENGIYHKTILTLRVLAEDATANNTQDIKKGDIILFDCASLSLTNQKCEVLASQRVTTIDTIEYNLQVAFYEIWS